MRRLSIIDLAGGDQPIFNEDRSVGVVMNGEIFNYVELQNWLRNQGHSSRPKATPRCSSTLYEEHGPATAAETERHVCLRAVEQEIALPAAGARPHGRQAALLCADRFAMAVWQRTQGASDAEAISTPNSIWMRSRIFSGLSYIPREATPYLRVRKLLPGHYLFIRGRAF